MKITYVTICGPHLPSRAVQYCAVLRKAGMSPRNHAKMKVALGRSMCLVTAWDGLSMIGAARIVGDSVFLAVISEIAVVPEYQRQGIGTRLLDLSLEFCHGMGMTKVRVFSRVHGAHKEAAAFYSAAGWGAVPAFRGFV